MRKLITVCLTFVVVGAMTIASFGAPRFGPGELSAYPMPQGSAQNRTPGHNYESLRLNRLAEELDSIRKEQEALSRFWEEMQDKTQLVESIPVSDSEKLV